MTRWKVYRLDRGGEYVGSKSARSRKAVQREFATFYKCPLEVIEVRSDSEPSPAEERLRNAYSVASTKGIRNQSPSGSSD